MARISQLELSYRNFLINIGPSLSNKIPNITNMNYTHYLTKRILFSFHFELVDETAVLKVIQSLKPKTSAGHDGISLKLLKYLAPGLLKPLTFIINQSLLTGIFPNNLKIAKVIPLFKKDNPSLVDNYRPISLLSSLSKLFEKIVFGQVFKYFTDNGLFHILQYGFREGHSTETATLDLSDRIINALDNNETPLAIFMDLSKAFDTLDHNILLSKLSFYGINGTALSWFKSYLSDRTQYVEIQSKKSTMLPITTGVPQGSILGPLLFLIYINDIPSSSDAFNFILYADDTTMFSTMDFSMSNLNCNDHINVELEKVWKWLTINKLSLNVDKTKFMLFRPKNRRHTFEPTLNINGITVERVETFKFWGVIFDENLSWKSHCNHISQKISKLCGVLNRLKYTLPLPILRTLYFSMVQSQLTYGMLTWGFQPNCLFKLQKKVMRVITRSKYIAHTEPLFKANNILKFGDLLRLNALLFYHKLLNNKLPPYFNSFILTPLNITHNYSTRHGDRIPCNITRTQFAQNCLRHSLPNLINDSPINIRNISLTHSIDWLKKELKRYFIDNYVYECHILGCYVCGMV